MDRERWQKIDRVFKSALEVPAAERAAFLERACAGDAGLRREVESLIAHEAAGSFMNEPAAGDAARLLAGGGASLVGQTVGSYKVLDKIGAGGMGEVYLALHERTSRKVALKLLPAPHAKDEQRVRRFRQEAQAVLALNHPNIVTVYDIEQAGGAHVIASEFIEGETLRAALARGPLTPHGALDVAIQAAGALAAAHGSGVVHRDIKPENIMLRTDGYVKVLDFGLAKLTERPEAAASELPTQALVNTGPGVVMGTVAYMSPEQARGRETDARTDIWSLGVVLYEALAGRAPFAGETSSDVVAAILQTEPPPLARFRPEVPDSLEWIVTKMLTKDREGRYQTAKELLADLKRLRRRLEFEAEAERSGAPQPSASSAAPTTAGGRAAAQSTAERTAATGAARAASSAEYVVAEIRKHKRGALVAACAALLAIAGVVFVALRYARDGAEGGAVDSLAVLPFQNVGGDPETEYFSDGITESLINSLSELPNLKVMSRHSVFRFKGQEADVQEAARRLGVRAVLTGRVAQRGDLLSVSAELVDARDQRQLWGGQYNRRLSDVLAVQQEIARDISARLRSRLTGEEMRRVTKSHTESVEAYQLYLKGRAGHSRHTLPSLKESVEYFNRAVALDPSYAPAYVGLAHSYGSLANMGGLPPNEGYLKAKQAAERAVELDDSLAEAHAAVAFVKMFYEWDWEGARRGSLRALELNPNSSSAHALYADYLRTMGRLEEALIEARREQELDPFHPLANLHVCTTLSMLGRHDEAVASCRKSLDLDPNFALGHEWLGVIYEAKGMYAEAEAAFANFTRINGRTPSIVALLGHTYAVSGRRAEALRALDEMKRMAEKRPVPAYWFALLYTGLGDREQAFAWLDRAYAERFFYLKSLKVDPRFAPLRPDPRFAELLARMKLA